MVLGVISWHQIAKPIFGERWASFFIFIPCSLCSNSICSVAWWALCPKTPQILYWRSFLVVILANLLVGQDGTNHSEAIAVCESLLRGSMLVTPPPADQDLQNLCISDTSTPRFSSCSHTRRDRARSDHLNVSVSHHCQDWSFHCRAMVPFGSEEPGCLRTRFSGLLACVWVRFQAWH